MTLTTHQYPREISNPKHLVVLLHGYGSNGRDLLSLAPELQEALPDAVFISPDAIYPFEGGMSNAFQWYSLAYRSEESMLEGARNALPIITDYIDAQLQRFNLTHDKLFLMGFSQGGMLTMYSAYRMPNLIAGAVSFSGFMVASDNLREEIKSRPPIFIAHGIEDSVVPVGALDLAQAELEKLDINVDSIKIPHLGHGIDSKAISGTIKFLLGKI